MQCATLRTAVHISAAPETVQTLATHFKSLLDPLSESMPVCLKSDDGHDDLVGQLVAFLCRASLNRVSFRLARVSRDDGEVVRRDGEDGTCLNRKSVQGYIIAS